MTEVVRMSAASPGVAVVCGDRRVTYAEFAARVNDLARWLIAAGVGPDVAVGVAMPRSVEMLVAIHAIVEAGGHYVPSTSTHRSTGCDTCSTPPTPGSSSSSTARLPR